MHANLKSNFLAPMDRKVLVILIGQFAIIAGLGVKIYTMGKATAPVLVAEAPVERERSKIRRPTPSTEGNQTKRMSAPTGDTAHPKPFDPTQARELLDRNREEIKNLNLRAEKAQSIIRLLCLNGYVAEAWELIDHEFGVVRSRELEAYFKYAAPSPAEVIARMNGLDDGDRGSALKGYLGSFTADEFAVLELNSFNFENRHERGALIRTFKDLLRAVGDEEDPVGGHALAGSLLEKAAKLTAENKLALADLGTLLDLDKSQDGFAHWAALTALPDGMRKADPPYTGVQAALMRKMAREDPERLMTITTTAGAPEARFMHIAFAEWLDADNASATQWYESRQESFTVGQKDCAAVAFLRACVANGEYENALKWYDTIVGAGWRSALAYEQRNALNGLKKNAAKQSGP